MLLKYAPGVQCRVFGSVQNCVQLVDMAKHGVQEAQKEWIKWPIYELSSW